MTTKANGQLRVAVTLSGVVALAGLCLGVGKAWSRSETNSEMLAAHEVRQQVASDDLRADLTILRATLTAHTAALARIEAKLER